MDFNKVLVALHKKHIEKAGLPVHILSIYKQYINSQFSDLGVLFLRYMVCFKETISKDDLKIALGIELFKTFGHIVDDVVDGDEQREGQPAFHLLLMKGGVGQKESIAITIHFGFILESLANQIFHTYDLMFFYTSIKERTLLGQIDEEASKNNNNYPSLYLKKTWFTSLPLQLACKLNNIPLPNKLLNDLVITDQKIDDLYDLLYKGTHTKNNNNTYFRAKFKDELKSPFFISNHKMALYDIIDEILTNLNHLADFLKKVSRKDEAISAAVTPQITYVLDLKKTIQNK